MQQVITHHSAQVVAIGAQAVGTASMVKHSKHSASSLHAFVAAAHSSAPFANGTALARSPHITSREDPSLPIAGASSVVGCLAEIWGGTVLDILDIPERRKKKKWNAHPCSHLRASRIGPPQYFVPYIGALRMSPS